MAITPLLRRLLDEVPGAVGVALLDEVGESIETLAENLGVEEMSTLGAVGEIQLRRIRETLGARGSEGGLLHVEGERLHLHALGLREGFLVVLAQSAGSLAAEGRNALLRIREQLEGEILS